MYVEYYELRKFITHENEYRRISEEIIYNYMLFIL